MKGWIHIDFLVKGDTVGIECKANMDGQTVSLHGHDVAALLRSFLDKLEGEEYVETVGKLENWQ